MRRADLPESALAAEADGLKASKCTTRAGFVGVVESVVENPGQFLLSVAPADGGRRVLVPLVDALVVGLTRTRAASTSTCRTACWRRGRALAPAPERIRP
ncbi:MAG: hypothetical protein ACLR3C_18800 [Eggerthella lenta]